MQSVELKVDNLFISAVPVPVPVCYHTQPRVSRSDGEEVEFASFSIRGGVEGASFIIHIINHCWSL